MFSSHAHHGLSSLDKQPVRLFFPPQLFIAEVLSMVQMAVISRVFQCARVLFDKCIINGEDTELTVQYLLDISKVLC